jgi:WD40 repeat protein
LWDAATGHPLATLTGHTSSVYAVVFSPDGKTLATASADHTARLWDAATGHPLATLPGHTDRVSAVVFSPDGKTLATTSADHTARLWDAVAFLDPINAICAAVGPPTQAEWQEYAPGEPEIQVCPRTNKR